MSSIVRCTFNLNNDNLVGKQILLSPCATENIIDQPDLYNVCVEKCRFPNVSKFRPIDNVLKPYNVALWYDLKDGLIPGIVYGFNFFEITGPIYSVEEFLLKMNLNLFKKAQPLNVGQFFLKYINGTPTIQFESGSDSINRTFDIYIDTRIINLFNFNYDLSDFVSHNGEELVRLIVQTGVQDQNSFSYDLFFKIEAIRIYSNMPTSEHYIQDISSNSLSDSDLLMEIYYNSTQFIGNNNIFYIPDNKVWSELKSSRPLNDIKIWFTYKYTDGSEVAAYLEKSQACRLTLLFEKKI